MAAESGRTIAGLAQQLLREPYRFDFFQAVRILKWLGWEENRSEVESMRHPVGGDLDPAREIVRFRAVQSQSFPSSAVTAIRRPPEDTQEHLTPSPMEMVVSFMGLTGPSGVLPHHYSRLMIERIREKDHSLQDFMDLFNHRLVSLFCRAWEKYRLPIAYEQSHLGVEEEDPITQSLFSLLGYGMPSLRDRTSVDDEAVLHYGGLFASNHRCAISLGALLSDYFSEVPVEVLQFQGQWFFIRKEDRSMLPSRRNPRGLNCRLGESVVLGERIWDVQSKLRIRVGPLDHRQFVSFIPSGDALRPLCQLARAYVGIELDFDVELVLRAAEVPFCRLGSEGEDKPELGRTTWLLSKKKVEPGARDEQVVFALDGVGWRFA